MTTPPPPPSSKSKSKSKSALAAESLAASFIPNVTRIRDGDGFVGTIRYVGPVASAKKSTELYAGVEWDDATRGKHDGSVISRTTNGIVRHFSLLNEGAEALGTGGSFLKVSKVDVGVMLDMNLIRMRYVTEDAELVAPNNILPYSARTSSGREKPIEFWGEMKVRKRQQLEDMNDISLRGMGISTIASRDSDAWKELRQTFGEHLTELDVAGNLMSDWDSMLEILKLFPNLRWLSFASNKVHNILDLQVHLPSTLADGTVVGNAQTFTNLKVLNVNRCSIASFSTIQALDRLCPNLEELCVAHSDLSDLGPADPETDADVDVDMDAGDSNSKPVDGFQKLKLLDCSSCKLTNWEHQVSRLSQLPNLETLILDDNPLTDVCIQNGAGAGSGSGATDQKSNIQFSSLANLQIAGTDISHWKDMEDLANLPQLTTLRLRKCPLTNEIGSGEARAGTIARVPKIEFLNASTISIKERLDAERRYVSTVSREMLLLQATAKSTVESASTAPTKEEPSILESFRKLGLHEKYTRFEELMAKHKESMLVAQSNSGFGGAGGSISSSALNVTIRSMAAESCTLDPLRKRLPSSLKIGRLKIMCARAFGLEVELQMLHFRVEGDAFPSEMDDDENTLAFYGVSDGAEILMNEVDVKAERIEQKKRAELQTQRIAEQERRTNAIHDIRQNEIRSHTAAAGMASDRMAS